MSEDFEDNAQLELMTPVGAGDVTYVSAAAFDIHMTVFDSTKESSVQNFLLQDHYTFVRQARVRFFADAGRLFTDMFVEGDSPEDAVNHALTTCVGSLACAGLNPGCVELSRLNVMSVRDRQANPDAVITDPGYDILDRGIGYFSAAVRQYKLEELELMKPLPEECAKYHLRTRNIINI